MAPERDEKIPFEHYAPLSRDEKTPQKTPDELCLLSTCKCLFCQINMTSST